MRPRPGSPPRPAVLHPRRRTDPGPRRARTPPDPAPGGRDRGPRRRRRYCRLARQGAGHGIGEKELLTSWLSGMLTPRGWWFLVLTLAVAGIGGVMAVRGSPSLIIVSLSLIV